MDERIKRFKHCDVRFYPYIDEVLSRIPEETRENILSDNSFTILSYDSDFFTCSGMWVGFESPVKDLVYLNSMHLQRTENDIIHTVAHELAHHVAGRGETNLYEKEAEELMQKWGFEEEVAQVKYSKPIYESRGYSLGIKWATEQDPSDLEEKFGEYRKDWDDGRISLERFEILLDEIDLGSIIGEMGCGGDSHREASDQLMGTDLSSSMGFVAGIMTVIKRQRMEHARDLPEPRFWQIRESLENIQNELSKLYDMEFFRERYFFRAAELRLPDFSEAIDQLIEFTEEDQGKELSNPEPAAQFTLSKPAC